MMLKALASNYELVVAILLFVIGFCMLLFDRNLLKKVIAAGLVLTGIVVSVSVSAVMLSLTVRIYQTYRTLDMDKLYMMMSHKKRQKEDGEQ